MFDIGFSELMVVGVISLVVMGPERLPETLRGINLWVGRIKASLSSAKKEIFDFFDNVKVNDDSDFVKKNRLELINILCKTFENFIDFHLIKDINEQTNS